MCFQVFRLLSLFDFACNIRSEKWGDRRGSNPRQPESQSGALPTELRPPQKKIYQFGELVILLRNKRNEYGDKINIAFKVSFQPLFKPREDL